MSQKDLSLKSTPTGGSSSKHHNYGAVPSEERQVVSFDIQQVFWEKNASEVSLPEVYRSVSVPDMGAPWWKKLYAYAGPGILVAVGYMDPGNWSTDIAGGSAYNYELLFIVLLSSIIAMFLQALSIKIGIAAEKDLAQACRAYYSQPVVIILWVVSEIAIIATDLAEVLGSAIALKMLFDWPLVVGVLVTAADVLIVLVARGSRIRFIEFLVLVLIIIITASFAWQLVICKPQVGEMLWGLLIPSTDMITDGNKLFISVSILGATVMPHSLFLHSSMVLTRASGKLPAEKLDALKYSVLDSSISLFCAFFVNAAILVVAAATFYHYGYTDVASLEDAYQLLDPLLGTKFANIAFGVALLAAGLNSTLTGTISGQIVMEGFMNWNMSPTYRRMMTRGLAIVPAMIVIIIGGEGASNYLLLVSQVVLSFALPFGVFPLVALTSDETVMGYYMVNSRTTATIAYSVAVLITALNVVLLVYALTSPVSDF